VTARPPDAGSAPHAGSAPDTVPAEFAAVVDGWAPPGETATDTVTLRPAHEFAALLDVPSPVERIYDALPPLWHWFLFPALHRSADLGADGHPATAAFNPPLARRRRMFGGGRLTVHTPLRVGDRVVRESRLAGVRAVRGGSGWLLVVTVGHDLSVGDDLRVREEQDLVYRAPSGAGGSPRASRSGAAAARPGGPWRLSWRPDPVALFRFSALTANAHRIHYDRPYATDVEGHGGLVVHGPLLALLMLELARRHAPEHRVTSYAWRAHAPLFDTDEVVVTGGPDGSFVAGSERAGAAVTATATLTPRG